MFNARSLLGCTPNDESNQQLPRVSECPLLSRPTHQLARPMDVRIADATALPLDDASADLAVAFMSLHDIDVSNGTEPGPRIGIQSGPLTGVGSGLSR